jgi:hypothetical protein
VKTGVQARRRGAGASSVGDTPGERAGRGHRGKCRCGGGAGDERRGADRAGNGLAAADGPGRLLVRPALRHAGDRRAQRPEERIGTGREVDQQQVPMMPGGQVRALVGEQRAALPER